MKNTFRLSFAGHASQGRRQLVALLERYPQARFVERAVGEYDVTADAAVEAELRKLPQWRVEAHGHPA